MQTNMFPSEYNKTVDERTNNKIYEAKYFLIIMSLYAI